MEISGQFKTRTEERLLKVPNGVEKLMLAFFSRAFDVMEGVKSRIVNEVDSLAIGLAEDTKPIDWSGFDKKYGRKSSVDPLFAEMLVNNLQSVGINGLNEGEKLYVEVKGGQWNRIDSPMK